MKALLRFLPCPTPNEWVEAALLRQNLLLIDHANCEKKAASTAMQLMYRHTEKPDLLLKMSQLAREELLHFQQIVTIISEKNIKYVQLGPSRYAKGLRELIAGNDNQKLVDTLIVGAFIEARSCERFSAILPFLDKQLSRFYRNLLKSEERHFMDYLELAKKYSDVDIGNRVRKFSEVEENLISESDLEFRFHSGKPVKCLAD
ncbi:MAG: tRNA isopentenyl-2-thiomethyl-A-37 hydroxylase MiaE [Gammaproteobacteria bacterium]|nr:tRNA isopentenyl-2-thiomethyl-A-37 hydroxylase MiaE [Gammaproteobacteria bacterium]